MSGFGLNLDSLSHSLILPVRLYISSFFAASVTSLFTFLLSHIIRHRGLYTCGPHGLSFCCITEWLLLFLPFYIFELQAGPSSIHLFILSLSSCLYFSLHRPLSSLSHSLSLFLLGLSEVVYYKISFGVTYLPNESPNIVANCFLQNCGHLNRLHEIYLHI